MGRCHYCRDGLSQEILERNRLCPGCGSDIHCCLNCTHYAPELVSRCREPETPWVADRAVQNQCPFFELLASPRERAAEAASGDTSEAEKAKKAFRALFRNP